MQPSVPPVCFVILTILLMCGAAAKCRAVVCQPRVYLTPGVGDCVHTPRLGACICVCIARTRLGLFVPFVV